MGAHILTIAPLIADNQQVYNLTVADLRTYVVGASPINALVHYWEPQQCTITADANQHMDDRHTENGRLRDRDASVWGVDREGRTRLINETVTQDPNGIPNTNGRDGTIHRAEFDDPVGRAGDSQGGYEVYEVEVILNPDGSVRNAYPITYIPDDD